MVTYNQIIVGIVKYIDVDVLPKIDGFRKLALGVGSSIALKKADEVFAIIKDNNILHALGIIDSNNNINIDILKETLLERMGEDKYPIDIPMIGTLTINRNDINRIYEFIMQS